MAIVSLKIAGPQPASSTTGRTTNVVEDWVCILDGQSTPAGVLALLRNGVSQYNFPSITEGTQNAADETVKAVNLSVSRIDNTGDQSKFKATVTYTNNATTLEDSNDPLEAQPQISADYVDRIVIVEQDTVSGEQITNSAKTQIIVEENDPIQKVTITRNEDDYRLSDAKSHAGKLNEQAVTILGETFPALHCLLQRWSGTNEYDAEGNLYWSVTYEILISDTILTKSFIQKGSVDLNGKAAASSAGLLTNKEYKLGADGFFLERDEQEDPDIFFTTDDFTTIRVSDWGRAVRLQGSPADSINDLPGGG